MLRPANATDFNEDDEELAKLAVPMLSAAYSRLIATEKLSLFQSLTQIHEDKQERQAIYLLGIDGHCLSQTRGAATLDTYLNQSGIKSIHEAVMRTTLIRKYIERCRLAYSNNKNISLNEVSEQIEISPGHCITLNSQASLNQSNQVVFMLSATSEHMDFPLNSVMERYDLTNRETEIVGYLRKGYNSNEIGLKLNISQWTVKNHLHTIYGKAGVRNRTELVNKISSCH